MAVKSNDQGNRYIAPDDLRDMKTGTGKSLSLDLSGYPSGAIQCIAGVGGAEVPVGLALDWEIALVDVDSAYVKYITGVAVADLNTKDKGLFIVPAGVRYVRGNVTALTSGKVQIVGFGQSQSS